ncbi:MAG: hypothetical protein MZV65_00050 [Chromatiales bacterium]|nr:hypothetical protein [Chromatiales bacterium]
MTHDQIEAMTLGQRIAVIHHGRLQQVAPPKEIYQHPANTFVAGFIGSPPMNLFATRMSLDDNGQLFITLGGHRLPATPPVLPADNGAADLERPIIGDPTESFRLVPKEQAGLVAEVVLVEYVGHETLLHFTPLGISPASPERAMVARFPGMHVFQKGEEIGLTAEATALTLCTEDGQAIKA